MLSQTGFLFAKTTIPVVGWQGWMVGSNEVGSGRVDGRIRNEDKLSSAGVEFD